MTATTSSPASAGHTTRFEFRHDVQWLRALAVLAVFAYHLDLPGASGGYVGVDVFFVVSGYLITRLLLLEHTRTGSIDLPAFATRRIRRLLPVSTVVLLVTLLWLWASAGVVRRAAERAVALGSALFGANIGLAIEQTDYLTADGEPVLQHYWSLGVEEQFYLLWPALLLATLALAMRAGWGRGVPTVAVALLVGGASAALAAIWTAPNQPYAFFLLPARAWELMAGVALAGLEHRGLTPRRPALWRWAGLVLVAAVVVGLVDGAFPWPLAVLPVVGTMALLWAGSGSDADEPDWMRNPAMQWIGDRSFGLYLWHWPPLVLLGLTAEHWSSRPLVRVAVVVGVFVATDLTYRIVEEPLRRGPLLRGHARPVAFLVVAVATSVAAALVVTAVPTAPPAAADEQVAADEDEAVRTPPTAAMPTSSPTADPSEDPLTRPLVTMADVPDELPDSVRAILATVGSTQPETYENDCHAPFAFERPKPTEDCTYGDATSDTTVALIGDSHAAQWVPAARLAAEEQGWALVVMSKSGCSLYEVDVTQGGEREYPQCPVWQQAVRDRLTALQPDVLLVAGVASPMHRADVSAWEDGTRSGLQKLRTAAPVSSLIMLLDPPHVPNYRPVPVCLDEEPIDACHLIEDTTFDQVQRAVAADLADVTVDVPALVCDEGICPSIIGDTLVYRDDDHFTLEFSTMLKDVVREAVQRALGD